MQALHAQHTHTKFLCPVFSGEKFYEAPIVPKH